MTPLGRPTLLNADIQNKLVEALKTGNYQETACKYAGISQQTLYNWMAKGEKKGEGIFFEFFVAINEAINTAEVELVKKWQDVIENTPSDHKAIKDFLERRYNKRWGRKDSHEVTGKDGEALNIEVKLVKDATS